MISPNDVPGGRARWIGALVGVFGFITGLQKHYVIAPVTSWLRDLPTWALVLLALAFTGLVLWTLWRSRKSRQSRIAMARSLIALNVAGSQ